MRSVFPLKRSALCDLPIKHSLTQCRCCTNCFAIFVHTAVCCIHIVGSQASTYDGCEATSPPLAGQLTPPTWFSQRVPPSSIADCTSQNRRRTCLLYTSPSPRDRQKSRMPSSA